MTSSSWLTSNKEKEKSLNVSGSAQFWRVIEYRDANYFDLPVIYTIFNPLYSHTAIGAKIMIFKKFFKVLFENPDFATTSDCLKCSSKAHQSHVVNPITGSLARYSIVYIPHTLRIGLSETVFQMVITSLQ